MSGNQHQKSPFLIRRYLLIFILYFSHSFILAQNVPEYDLNEKREFEQLKFRESALKVKKDTLERGRYKTERIFSLIVPLLQKEDLQETDESFIKYWYQQHAQYQEEITQLMLDKQSYLLKKTIRQVSDYINLLPPMMNLLRNFFHLGMLTKK
jgi:hypothetical protein